MRGRSIAAIVGLTCFGGKVLMLRLLLPGSIAEAVILCFRVCRLRVIEGYKELVN